MKKIRVTRSVVPNLLTLGNIFSGFAAIVYLANNDFRHATLYIFLAAIFDLLDGIVARILRATSEIGAELDSLCDAVSFGVAPSFMLYQAYFYKYNEVGILLASLPALAGVLRLARFNVQLVSFEDKLYFKGMPIPAGALTIMSFVMFYLLDNTNSVFSLSALETKILAFLVVILVPLAMVSSFKYDNLPRPTKQSFKKRPVVFILITIAIIVTVITKGYAVFPIMMFYLVVSPLRNIIIRIIGIFRAESKKNKIE